MYSRSIYPDRQDEVRPPENYDGNAFKEPESAAEALPSPKEEASEAISSSADTSQKGKGIFSSLFTGSPLTGLFGGKGIPFLSSFGIPKIGTEELIIIAAAAYLFFSSDGDKECAVILLLLLFVN